MRYRANKKVPRRRQQDPHQKQYVPLSFGGGHNDCQHGFRAKQSCETQILTLYHELAS